jgi:hypothetical protein
MATIKEVTERVLETVGLVSAQKAAAQINRAYEAGVFDGNDDPQSGTIAAGGFGYRSHGQRGKRDFSQMSQDQIINTVWSLYQSNGIAERALEFRKSTILGRNTKPETSDEPLQEILDQFWNRNFVKTRNLSRFVTAHSLFGELILPVFVRETDGRVLLGYIDQGDVEEVVFHPENNLERWSVVLKEQDGKKRVYRIVREDEGVVYGDTVISPKYPGKLIAWQQATLEPWEQTLLKAHGLSEYSGSTFYFDKNNLANQPRGFSDLLQSADWLDQNDEVLFSLADREQFANYFSWLVKMTGATPERVSERANELNKKKPFAKGQVNVHNENEEWSFVTADLKQPGSVVTAQATKKQALEGLNQPETWHNEMDTSNRATADKADNPANRWLQHEQGDLVQMLTFACQFAADQAEIASVYRPEEDNQIFFSVPEIVKSDNTEVADSLATATNALTVAMMDLKVITRETAARVVARIIAEFGVDYNPADELEKVDEAIEQAAMETQADVNSFLASTIERNGNG